MPGLDRLGAFAVLELITPAPLVNARALGRRNCGLKTAGNFPLGFALHGSVLPRPEYLTAALGFDSQRIGEVMAWIGLAPLPLTPLAPPLMKRLAARVLAGRSWFMTIEMDRVFTMIRNRGGASGTAAIETFFPRRERFHAAILTPNATLLEPVTRARLTALRQYFMARGFPDPAMA